MPVLLKLLLLIPLLPTMLLGVGLSALPPRFRLNRVERLMLAPALTLLLLFLLGFVIRSSSTLRLGALFFWLLTFVSILLIPLNRRLFRAREVRSLALSYLALVGIGFLSLCWINHYSGGMWYGDWFEHYERALFFVGERPLEYSFLSRYLLPARPPLMNAATSLVLAGVDQSFAIFQVSSLLLNALIILPMYVIAKRVASLRAPGELALFVFLCCLSPFILQNITYTWTKLLSAYFVLCSMYFCMEKTTRRLVLVFPLLTAAVLTHYSAAPFAIFFGAFALLRCLKARRGFAWIFGSALLFSLWLCWSIYHYGLSTTLGGNTTVQGYAKRSFQEAASLALQNITFTLVPWPLHMKMPTWMIQPDAVANFRDGLFLLQQTNLLFAPTLALTIFGVCQLTALHRKYLFSFLLVGATILGVITVGDLELFGVTHAVLQPTVLFLAALGIAGAFRSGKTAQYTVIACLLLEVTIGFVPHMVVQHRTSTEGLNRVAGMNLQLSTDLELVSDILK